VKVVVESSHMMRYVLSYLPVTVGTLMLVIGLDSIGIDFWPRTCFAAAYTALFVSAEKV